MHMIGLTRLGRDMEVRTLPNGSIIGQLALAYNWGKKAPGDGMRPTQWIEAALFGERANVLEPYLKKGTAIVVTLDDLRVEEYRAKNNEMRSTMKARVVDVEFVGGGKPNEARPGASQQRPASTELDDDIPF